MAPEPERVPAESSGAELRGELLRKVLHIGFGLGALLLRWLVAWQAAALALLALSFNLFALHRITGRRLLREEERHRGFSWGVALYPAVVLGLVLVFRQRLELAAACWALIGFGDGMATVCGRLVGGPRLPWNRGKSWAGFGAFVLYGTATSAFLIRWTQRAWIDAAVDTPAVGGSFLSDTVLPASWFLLLGCFAASLAAAVAESIAGGPDDNVRVPLVGGTVLYAATIVDPARLAAALGDLGAAAARGAPINAVLAGAALALRGVSRTGAIAGWVLGTLVYALAGWRGFLMLALFFALGTVTTRMGYRRKRSLGIAQPAGGRRGPGHALANGSMGVLCAFLAVATPFAGSFTIAMIAAFATAAADTVASEIGQAYARRHYRVTGFKQVAPGTTGAVSLLGTLAGLGAGAVVAGAAWSVGLLDLRGAAIVTVAALFGMLVESYIGAAAARWRWADDGWINFTNTWIGAMVAMGLFVLFA